MSGNQNGEVRAKQPNPGKIALIGAIAVGLAVINMMTNGPEAPSQGLMILQYAGLAGGLLALVGGLIMISLRSSIR